MKKTTTLFLLTLILLITGCSGGIKTTAVQDKEPYVFKYENPYHFAADEEGSIYYISYTAGENPSAKLMKESDDGTVEEFDGLFEPVDFVLDLWAGDGTVYCAANYLNASGLYRFGLFKISLADKSRTLIAELPDIDNVKNLCYSNGFLYFITNDEEKANKTCETTGTDNFDYLGETIMSVSVANGTIGVVDVDFPQAIDASGDRLVIYGYESGKGYCFTVMNTKDNSVEAYSFSGNLGQISEISLCGDTNDFVTISQLMPKTVISADIEGKYGASILANDERIGLGLWYRDNSIIYSNFEHVYKKEIPQIRTNTEPLKVISTSYYMEKPMSYGYAVKYEDLDAENFALSVLSQDKNYDVCLIASGDDSSSNISKNGAMYPLNDIPYVEEYINSCFPYVKDAVTDADGNIWAIPYELSANVYFANNSLFDECGLSYKDVSLDDYLNIAEKLCSEKKYSRKCSFWGYLVTKDFFEQLLTAGEISRISELASTLSKRYNISTNSALMDMSLQNQPLIIDGKYDKVMLFLERNALQQPAYGEYSDIFSVFAVPSVTESDKNIIKCSMLSVNPASDNLDAALGYVSLVAQKRLENNTGIMLSDKNLYPENSICDSLYDIYSNGTIPFGINSEIFWNSYLDLLAGNITLEQFSADAESNYSKYINE